MDQRTRVMLFALNLSLQPGENSSAVTADAEDAAHRFYPLQVEYVGPVPEQEWVSQIVVRLDDNLGDVGDVLVRIVYHGQQSNRVRVGIGHVGGGPPDDPTSISTPGSRNVVTGRVTDAGGRGLGGVTVTLSGTNSSTATATTGLNGSYYLIGPADGPYSVVASHDQNYFTFSPTPQSLNLSGSAQAANFTGQLVPISSPFSVLEFDGTPKTVDYGTFFPEVSRMGHFYWEVWAAPGNAAGATYLLSDGYGGAHALLLGFGSLGTTEEGRYQLLGDVWNTFGLSNGLVYFGGDQGPAPGEWGHIAVGWDGARIITYFDGVPVGKKDFTGPRISLGSGVGGGHLLIGGSDHNNYDGRIAQVRGYEGTNPRETSAAGPEVSFAPDTLFSIGGNLLSYYFTPSRNVADLSPIGFNGSIHRGRLKGTLPPYGTLHECPHCPLPQYVIDPTAPNFANPNNPGQMLAPLATPLPSSGGARIFDSFSRKNATLALGGTGGIGSTEAGALGPQLWRANVDPSQQQPFGLLNGVAVLLANSASVAWVPTGANTGSVGIQVERRPGTWGSGISTGLSFRVLDAHNFFFAYTTGSSAGSQLLTAGYYQAGNRVEFASGIQMPYTWTVLRVVTSTSGKIELYADAKLVYSMQNSNMVTATGAGLFNAGPRMSLVNRWDNFTVYDP
jgi:hypothetical protein